MTFTSFIFHTTGKIRLTIPGSLIRKIALVVIFSTSVHSYTEAQSTASRTLTIQGKEIWVRDKPVTGKVVMKLNSGSKCRIFGITEPQVIAGKFNFWFNIEFEGKRGWVFGSQSNLAASVRDESYEQTWSNFEGWLKIIAQTVEGGSVSKNDMGLTFDISAGSEGGGATYTFNRGGLTESNIGYYQCNSTFVHSGGSEVFNKTFVLGLKDSAWEFIGQFDGVVVQTIKWDAKRLMFLGDDQKFSAGIRFKEDGKGGGTQSFVETLQRSLVVATVGTTDLVVRIVQTTSLFKENAPSKRAGMFGPIEWNAELKTISATSTKLPSQFKWDQTKGRFVPQ